MSLGLRQSAVDGRAQVLASLFRHAAVVFARQPSAVPTSDGLADFSCDRDTSAEVPHTNGTLRDAIHLPRWVLER